MGEVRPEHQPRAGGEGLPAQVHSAEGRPAPSTAAPRALGSSTRVTPAVWTAPRREERLESARSRLPPPGQQQEGAPNFGASSRRPQPLTRAAARGPRRPPRPAGSCAHPRRLAREPLPPTKPPPKRQSPRPLPAAASPGSSLTKKLSVVGRLGGPPWVVRPDSPERLPDLHSQNFTRLARSDSEGVGSPFSRAVAAPAPPFFLAKRVPTNHLPPLLTD